MISPICLCAPVSAKALSGLLESGASNQGAYKDAHPWLIARKLWQQSDSTMCIILAVDNVLQHYGEISAIDVEELHRGSWVSRVQFGPLRAMNPIWETLDSVFLWPSAEQREREQLEGLRSHRTALSAATLHPYAICETPEFMRTTP
ncbi:MAG: hypothetical protein AB8B93_14605 [Pseudomonadales bacterium]